jgi:pimeloyl-ACP methyl ester carboxylesterase
MEPPEQVKRAPPSGAHSGNVAGLRIDPERRLVLAVEFGAPHRAANAPARLALAGYKLGVPVTYVRLDADQTYPPELQEQAQRITAATPVHINAGHMAMISQPEKLAAVINAVD